MSFLRDSPIRQKLTVIVLLVTSVSLVLAFSLLFIYEFQVYRKGLTTNLSTLADVVGDNSTAALSFQVRQDAEDILSSLDREPQIIAACLYLRDPLTDTYSDFAKYRRPGFSAAIPAVPEPDGYRFGRSSVHVFRTISDEPQGKPLGVIYLQADQQAMRERLGLYAVELSVILILAMVFAVLISNRLQKYISVPIMDLARLAGLVSDKQDYSVRAKRTGDDEVGQLTDAFNHMLEQVQRREQALTQANKELESFSYSVSHDLRAPLRHVIGFGELLERRAAGALDEKATRHLGNILEAARKMGNLIDDLLVFSRMGRAAITIAEVDMRRLVDEVIYDLRIETERRKIDWKIPQALPVVQVDRNLIRQVWSNLIGNAIKYSKTRDVATIEIGGEDQGDGFYRFWVKDNGAGFDMNYVHKLFGVFQRLHDGTEFEGTGIGLANVKRIVVRHGGNAWGEGKVGEGATFYFSLPKVGVSLNEITGEPLGVPTFNPKES